MARSCTHMFANVFLFITLTTYGYIKPVTGVLARVEGAVGKRCQGIMSGVWMPCIHAHCDV